MSESSVFKAGCEGKSDLIVSFEPGFPGFEIVVESSIKKLFGSLIKKTAEEACSFFGVKAGKLSIKDDGALDFSIWARIEAVFRMSGKATSPKAQIPKREPAQKDRLRRSRLYIPGNQPDLMINAGLFGADSIILDLEDSVAPSQKVESRILVRRMLESASTFFPAGELIVRVNPLKGPFGRDDLMEIIPSLPHVILIPKCETASDIVEIEQIVNQIEEKHGIQGRTLFMPLIETGKGVVNAAGVASASPRNVALCFGAEDFTRDLGISRTKDGKETFLARQQIVLAAKSANIQAIDTVFSDVGDEAGLLSSALEAKSLGFVGKGLIHPRQIDPVHRAFAPTEQELDDAKKIVAAFREAEKTGSGVVALGSKMIDAPVAERARKVLDLAKKIGMKGAEEI
ncbi:MAG: HpcH/HpaI aldolase/citrate lyase family protein [Candidatus Riflebacteria bacterium]|nr:HpcH/HpaI aldolase/citrate lyase family protein [Candidatus Riflebacteria bacterium]